MSYFKTATLALAASAVTVWSSSASAKIIGYVQGRTGVLHRHDSRRFPDTEIKQAKGV